MTKSSPFLRYEGNCDTRKWPVKFRDFRETGPWVGTGDHIQVYVGKMASSLMKQDLPPKGGYPPIEYARNLPKRGPSGVMMFIGGAAVMAFGFYYVIMGNRRRW